MFSFSTENLVNSQNSFVASNIEREIIKNDSKIVNYSINFQESEKPNCYSFMKSNFGINVGPYSLDHDIFCYAKFHEETKITLNKTSNLITDKCDSIFVSDLSYFFNKPTKILNNTVQSSEPYIRISVSKSIADKILNSNTEVDGEVNYDKLANTFIDAIFLTYKVRCLVYSIILENVPYYSDIFSDELIAIHDTELSIENFDRIISLPCGKHRNTMLLDKLDDNVNNFGRYQIFYHSNTCKIIIDLSEKLVNYNQMITASKIMLPISLVDFAVLLLLLLFSKMNFLILLISSFLISVIFESVKIILTRITKMNITIISCTSVLFLELYIVFFYIVLSVIIKFIGEIKK